MKYSREKFILAASYGSVILIESSDKKCLKLKNLTHSLQFFFSYKSSVFSYFIFLVNKENSFCVWKFLRIFYFLNTNFSLLYGISFFKERTYLKHFIYIKVIFLFFFE